MPGSSRPPVTTWRGSRLFGVAVARSIPDGVGRNKLRHPCSFVGTLAGAAGWPRDDPVRFPQRPPRPPKRMRGGMCVSPGWWWRESDKVSPALQLGVAATWWRRRLDVRSRACRSTETRPCSRNWATLDTAHHLAANGPWAFVRPDARSRSAHGSSLWSRIVHAEPHIGQGRVCSCSR